MSPIVIKYLPFKTIKNYTIIFNNAINHCYFPVNWKCAKVLPLLKIGKAPEKISSYRPISLTPAWSKVFEIVIDNEISAYCKQHKIIPNNQFRFKVNHSITYAIHKVTSGILKHLDKNEIVAAALRNLEKAFDFVLINELIFIFINEKFPRWLILILIYISVILCILTGKSFKVWKGMLLSNIIFLITEGFQ